jgi:hypothetical protein
LVGNKGKTPHNGPERTDSTMRTRAKLALVAIGLSATVVAGIAGPVFAATIDQPAATSSTAPAPSSTTAHAGTRGHGPFGRRFGAEFAKDLAAQLGLPQQQVTTALQQVRAQMQADHKAGTATPAEFVNQLAAKLGVDQTKVKAAVQAVGAQGRADRLTQLKARLDAAVKAGKVSQSDADAYLRVVQSGALQGAMR